MGMTPENLCNKKFNMLLAVERVFYNGKYKWHCICDCGNETYVIAASLKNNNTMSCGCLGLQRLREGGNNKHGQSSGGKTAEYICWKRIRAVCTNRNNKSYVNYGGRGIRVSKRWMDSFDNFFKDMGKRPSNKHSLERKNVNGNYTKYNCIWATMYVQQRNKRNSVKLTYLGVTKNQCDWAKEIGVSPDAIIARLKKGMSFPEIYKYYSTGIHKNRQNARKNDKNKKQTI